MNVEERIQYYMGKWYNNEILIDNKQIEKFPKEVIHWNDLAVLYNDHIYENYPNIPYIEDLKELFKKTSIPDINGKFLVQLGDLPSIFPELPILMNHRNIILKDKKYKDQSIIFKLDLSRHWRSFDEIDKNDIKWEEKNNCFVWRGITTGYEEDPPRFRLVRNYKGTFFVKDKFKFFKNILLKISLIISIFSQKIPLKILKNFSNFLNNKCNKYVKFNIGFNEICQNQYQLKKYVKGFMSIQSQLQNKYLISIQGNDVATNLKWALYSNSLVFMPKPTVESWLMEDTLKPYIHYIPLDDELNNLDEIYKWCIANDEKCKEIARNATLYMEQFMDIDQENKIMLKIMEKYVQNVKIEKSPNNYFFFLS